MEQRDSDDLVRVIEAGCIAPVQEASAFRVDPYCARGARVGVAAFLQGDQPLCIRHREKIEHTLQRLMLGIDRIVVPSQEQVHSRP